MKTFTVKISAALALIVLLSSSFLLAARPDSSGTAAPPKTETLQDAKTIGALTLTDAKSCQAIEAHAPTGIKSTFSKDVGKVWIYSKFTLPKETESTVSHVYYFKGQEISKVDLKVKGPSFRTNSYKTIKKNMVGDWKVEVQADNGEIFETIEFTIIE